MVEEDEPVETAANLALTQRPSRLAARLGEVISVSGSHVVGLLTVEYEDAPSDPYGPVQVGALLRLPTSASDAYGIVESLRVQFDGSTKRRLVSIQLIGEVAWNREGEGNRAFERGVSAYPSLEAPIFDTTREDLAIVYARPEAVTAQIGSLFQDPGIAAFVMTDELLSKHFAILGTTGCGKSCAVALILRMILREHPGGHIVMLDPHDEYTHAFRDQAEVIRPTDLDLPYWLLNFEETLAIMVSASSDTFDREAAVLKDGIIDARRRYAVSAGGGIHRMSVDAPSPYRLTDLLRFVDQQMGSLNKPENSVPYLRLKARIESLSSDVRLAFMFPGHIVEDNFKPILSRLLRMPVDKKPITILDISALPAEIVDVVVSVVCRVVFDHAVWSDRETVTPVLLVCEEAHRYAPEYDKLGFQPTKRALARIAKEGRKYGVSLCLVSQRPSELSISTLSQCSTIFAMRMANESDHEFVGNALPESARTFLASLAALRTREAIVMGEGVTVPMRVLFDPLPPEHRPHSDSSLFSKRWAQTEVDYDALLSDTISRWRANAREVRVRKSVKGSLRSVVEDRVKASLDDIGEVPADQPRPGADK